MRIQTDQFQDIKGDKIAQPNYAFFSTPAKADNFGGLTTSQFHVQCVSLKSYHISDKIMAVTEAQDPQQE